MSKLKESNSRRGYAFRPDEVEGLTVNQNGLPGAGLHRPWPLALQPSAAIAAAQPQLLKMDKRMSRLSMTLSQKEQELRLVALQVRAELLSIRPDISCSYIGWASHGICSMVEKYQGPFCAKSCRLCFIQNDWKLLSITEVNAHLAFCPKLAGAEYSSLTSLRTTDILDDSGDHYITVNLHNSKISQACPWPL